MSSPIFPLGSTGHPSPNDTPSPKLLQAANAFEANFLGELLKPMREDPLFGNGAGLGGDSLGSEGPNGGSMGTIGSLASEALAQAIVRQGGLGIAKMVLAQLAPVEQSAAHSAIGGAGPTCENCTADVAMSPAIGNAEEAGSVAMLGQGNLDQTGVHPAGKNLSPNTVRKKATKEGAESSISAKRLRPLGSQSR